jgi:hypothetical protein
LNKGQRLFWAQGLRDLSHLAAAALIFGQAFTGKFSPWLFALGFGFVVVAYSVGHCCPGKISLRADKYRGISWLTVNTVGNDLKWGPRKMAL